MGLPQSTLNDIHRPELPPQALRTLQEREQLGQIPEQPGHELRISEGLGLGHRLGPLGRLIDRRASVFKAA
jgi:hypothetical protein